MKVFLSSTYTDLIEHRKAAHDALEKLGLHVIWMEAFGARPDESTKACLDEVEESDLFIGIYAHRYGYIPSGADVSITEQEFDHAHKLEKPIFGFIINDEHPWSPKQIEHDKSEKLNVLLSKVKNQPIEFFTTADNLAQKIASSIGRYLSELKAAEEARQREISVNVGGNFSGNLTIGDYNTSNNSIGNFQSHKPRGNTLPRLDYFVGRDKELEIIKAALSPETRAWGALIDGPGGIGKTTLAIRAAHLAPANLFDRKIFITAKVRELTPEGEKKLTDFTRPTYLAMLDELGKELGEEGLEKLPPDERPNEIRLALAGKKALIVFDNLETLPEEERTRLFQFLSRLPEGNKAIVTSRRRDDVDARIIRLDRLSHEEAMQLIEELAKKYPRLQRATKDEHEKLYTITQGNPLFIRWITGQLGREGSKLRTIEEAVAFIDKAPKSNDPLEYIFGDLLETFSPDETKVLAALTHFTQPAKLKWLSQMADLPERSTETALEDLADRSILIANIESKAFYLPLLAAQFIKTRRPEAVTQTGNTLTDRAYALALQNGGATNYEGFRILDAEWDFISAALPRLLTGENGRLQTLCEQLYQFLIYTGRWDDLLWISIEAEVRAINANDKFNAGLRAFDAGNTYFSRNQPTEVLAYAARAAEHWQDSTLKRKAAAIRLRGHGHKLSKEYSTAIAAYREVLDILRNSSPESKGGIASALHDIAITEQAIKNYDIAENDYRTALNILTKENDKAGIAAITGSLASLALDREQWGEAESLAREALVLAEKVGRLELIANNCRRIAIALLKQNKNLDEALTLSRRAIEIFTRLRHPDLQSAQELLEEIERAIHE